jgi:endogenous inhibitor of DNA gyrase (YacG/DUF329 family)
MSKRRTFKCEICEKKVDIHPEDKTIPECCGQDMKEDLPVCTTTDTAEHARFYDSGEPCDDGRAGKN